MPTKDINLARKYRREWYQRNKEHAISKIKERKQSLKQWFRDKKSTLKCSTCDEDHPATLDFHHLDSTKKDIVISQYIGNWSQKKIEEEIAKCQVLCSNCHRKLHYEERWHE